MKGTRPFIFVEGCVPFVNMKGRVPFNDPSCQARSTRQA
jgi:hypothetical protein